MAPRKRAEKKPARKPSAAPREPSGSRPPQSGAAPATPTNRSQRSEKSPATESAVRRSPHDKPCHKASGTKKSKTARPPPFRSEAPAAAPALARRSTAGSSTRLQATAAAPARAREAEWMKATGRRAPAARTSPAPASLHTSLAAPIPPRAPAVSPPNRAAAQPAPPPATESNPESSCSDAPGKAEDNGSPERNRSTSKARAKASSFRSPERCPSPTDVGRSRNGTARRSPPKAATASNKTPRSTTRTPGSESECQNASQCVILAAPVVPDYRQHIHTVLEGIEVRLLARVNGRDRNFGDAQALDARQHQHLQIEIERARELLPGNRLHRPPRVQHVAAVILGQLHSEGPILDPSQNLVRDELVERHASAQRPAAPHARSLHDIGLVAIEGLQQLRNFFRRVLSIRMKPDADLGALPQRIAQQRLLRLAVTTIDLMREHHHVRNLLLYPRQRLRRVVLAAIVHDDVLADTLARCLGDAFKNPLDGCAGIVSRHQDENAVNHSLRS